MKQLLNNIKANVLFKVASLNSVSVIIRIVSGFLTSKAIAFYLGAEGLAIIGNLRNFLSSIQSISTLGLYNGIVKYIAETKDDFSALSKTVSTVSFLGLFSTILISLVCYFNANEINRFVFLEGDNYSYIIKILAVALPFYTLNVLISSVLNGFSKYKKLLIINSVGQVIGTFITVFLIWKKNIDGALIAVVTTESIIFFITLISVFSKRRFISVVKFSSFSFSNMKKLSAFSVMALFSAIVLPFVTITIRTYIVDTIDVQAAGFWEAMTRLSKYYLMFVSSLLTLYILPKFSEINTEEAFRKEVFNFYKTIVPVFGLGLIIIYFLRFFIIKLIFTEVFLPVESLFFWQLLGDFVKVLALVISYQFLAKKMFWHYIITEILSIIILYFSSIYFINEFGVKGATIAHFVNYLLYFAMILFIFRSALFSKQQKTH